MPELTVNDVVQNIEILERDYSLMRLENGDRRDVYSMRRIPLLPPDLARNEQVNILSPDIINVAKAMRAFLMTFVTEITNIPTARDDSGTTPEADKKKADYAERAAAAFYMGINPDRNLELMRIWRQEVEPLAVVILECGAVDSIDPAKRFIWSAFDVDLDGCGWLEKDGIPTVFGRKFKQSFFEAQKQYSFRKGGPGEDKRLTMETGAGRFAPATDDRSIYLTRSSGKTGKGFDELELGWYDDGRRLYHVALTRSTGFSIGPLRMGRTNSVKGDLLWSGENPFGRVSAFLVPGNRTAMRAPEDHYEAFLQELLTNEEQMNVVLSTIATTARNRAAPRSYLHADGESLAEYIRQNGGKLPPPTEWEDGKTPVMMGEIKEPPSNIDPTLVELMKELQSRRERFTPPSFQTLQKDDVLIGATAAAVLAAYDSASQFMSPMVGAGDTFLRQALEGWEHCVKWYSQKYPKYAEFALTHGAGDYVRTKNGKAGQVITVDKETFDFPHTWRVSTKSRTTQQQAAREDIARARFTPLPDGRRNVGIYDDLFDAMDEPDPTERLAQMTTEGVLEGMLDASLKQAAAERVQRFIALDSGQLVDLGGAAPMPAPAPPGTGGAPASPGGGSHTSSPATEQTVGGSGPTIV